MDKVITSLKNKNVIDTKSQSFANATNDIQEIVWESITDKRKIASKQFMTIWHRPKEDHLKALKVHRNLTVVLTLQTKNEDIEFIQKFCEAYDVKWFNIPLHHKGNQDLFQKEGSDDLIIKSIKEIVIFLAAEKEQNIFIHCSAGIHRSGVISYALLRALSYEKGESLQKVKQIRKMTFNGLNEYKINRLEEQIIPIIIQDK